MLFLMFQLGKDRYVLDASHVVEVLPLIGASHIVTIRRHAVADDAGADLV